MKCVSSIHVTFCCALFSYGIHSTWSSSTMLDGRNMVTTAVENKTLLMENVASGTRMAMAECKKIFKWDRWNCPESAFSSRGQQSATKEQAVVQAIVAAGLVHALAENCSKGVLQECGCNPNLRKQLVSKSAKRLFHGKGKTSNVKKKNVDWSWGGCNHDVEYGEHVAKSVLKKMLRGAGDPQTFVTAQNNLVGRKLVRETMIKRCKCHGISGSCSMQTCWLQVAPFSKIVSLLKERHKKAVKINWENRSNHQFSVGNSRSKAIGKEVAEVSSDKLVFLEDSPDYCVANNTTNWPGTKGRMCSRSRFDSTSLAEKRSCRHLCRKCGLKVRKQKRELKWKCNCSFKWCCEVECETCTQTVEEFFCQ